MSVSVLAFPEDFVLKEFINDLKILWITYLNMAEIKIIKHPVKFSLNVSELILIDLPKAEFDKYSWWINDSFMDFFERLLSLTVQNLILNRVLVCNKVIEDARILWICKFPKIKYYLRYNTEMLYEDESLLEGKIVEIAKRCGSIESEKLLTTLLYSFIDPENKPINAGKYLILEILNNQKLGWFEVAYKNTWFSYGVKVQEKSCYDSKLLKSIYNAVIQEKLQNQEFKLWSEAFEKQVQRQINKASSHGE